MPDITERNRGLKFDSPLGSELVLHRFDGEDRLGRLYEYELELQSTRLDIGFADIVGMNVTVVMEWDRGPRYFNGYVTEFAFIGTREKLAMYRAKMRPRLWFLSQTSDCRVFQNKSVPDIVKEVLQDNGLADFRLDLTGIHKPREYCVQYRETDFAFVSRLMEQEGIYYYFEHDQGKHTLVLADSISAHKAFPGYDTVLYYPREAHNARRSEDHLQEWSVRQIVVPEKVVMQDYDFEKPKVNLETRSTQKYDHPSLVDAEMYDYPGLYTESADGENFTRVGSDMWHAQQERAFSEGNARGIHAGCVFELKNFPRKDQNRDYLVVSVRHSIRSDEMMSGSGTDEEFYRCHIEVVDKSTTYRSRPTTPKPVVQGSQTAVVVGPGGEEIHCDEYGRIKVQFHWDRYGKSDQHSSCWVRVSQLWAGKGWGGMHIPRIGQEVVVSFLEGDPDQPLVIGRVYNAANMPPYGLDENKTRSGIMSRSSKDGSPDNYNEIRMEDKKGEEELYIQAEKDENILVKNDKSEKVGANENVSIGNNRAESVGANETLTVKKNRTRLVEKNESVSISESRTHSVGKNENLSIGKNQSVSIGAKHSTDVGDAQSLTVAKARTMSVGKNLDVSVGDNESRSVGKKLVVNAGDSILLKCGSASISMKKNGDIVISGKNLTLKASSKIDAKASSTVTIKGAQVKEN